jgi:hypothetical protein
MSAADFRRQHCAGAIGFVDFEVIIEHDVGINIEPVRSLKRETGRFAALSADGKNIYVDAGFQAAYSRDYLSLLNHELGHAVHHLTLVPEGGFPTLEAFTLFHNSITDVVRTQLEYEARTFGLYLQMPPEELWLVFLLAIEQARDMYASVNTGAARVFIHERVADHFRVNATRAELHIHAERLWKRFRREELHRKAKLLTLQERIALRR